MKVTQVSFPNLTEQVHREAGNSNEMEDGSHCYCNTIVITCGHITFQQNRKDISAVLKTDTRVGIHSLLFPCCKVQYKGSYGQSSFTVNDLVT